MIANINEVEVNAANIESVLGAIRKPQIIKLTLVSPITYANLERNDLLLSNLNVKTTKTVAASKSITVIQGDRVKCSDVDDEATDDLFLMVLILSFSKEKLQRNKRESESQMVRDLDSEFIFLTHMLVVSFIRLNSFS
jgi:hypothetical protein